MDRGTRRIWVSQNQGDTDLDYHKILTAGLTVQQGIVRQKIISVYLVDNLEAMCQLVIQAFEAGIDFQENADSFLLMLCLHHAYQGDYKLFLESNAVQYLEGHGFKFELRKKDGVNRLEELLPAATSGKNIRRTLAALPEEETTEANAGQFLSFASLFLPKLVVGEKACLEKVQRQIQVHAEQGLIQYPTAWQSVGHMMVIFRLMRTNFLIKYLLIHQGMHMVAGHDANDAVIANSVAQARFSGLLIVKTVLDHILQKTDQGVRLHPLARTAKVRNEVNAFKAALSSLAKHGEYAPFARLLNLSGVNNLEHGLYPQLSAIALGVATAHGSTLAGVNVGEQYQQLREAATEAEKQLQQYAESRELDSLGLDDQERRILMNFHQKKNEISFQQTNAMVTLRKERLAKLTEAITLASRPNLGSRQDDDNEIPFPGPTSNNPDQDHLEDDPRDSRDTIIPNSAIDPEDGDFENYNGYHDDEVGTAGDLVLFDLDDHEDDNKAFEPQDSSLQSQREIERERLIHPPPGNNKDDNRASDNNQQSADSEEQEGQYNRHRGPERTTANRRLSPVHEEDTLIDQGDDDPSSPPPLESDDDDASSSQQDPDYTAVAPPAPVYRSAEAHEPPHKSSNEPAETSQLNEDPDIGQSKSMQKLEETYHHLLRTQGPFEAINYYHMMKDEPVIFSTDDGKEYTYPDSLEEAYPPWLTEKERLDNENRYIYINNQQFFWPVMSPRDKFLAILQHHQ
uniref:Nucleoprotein n=1 Tax=Reston ebolavirus TaxID=186539 RepID=A0A1Y0K5E6_9MONO|nr:NP [Reston ebolavirus]